MVGREALCVIQGHGRCCCNSVEPINVLLSKQMTHYPLSAAGRVDFWGEVGRCSDKAVLNNTSGLNVGVSNQLKTFIHNNWQASVYLHSGVKSVVTTELFPKQKSWTADEIETHKEDSTAHQTL